MNNKKGTSRKAWNMRAWQSSMNKREISRGTQIVLARRAEISNE